MTAVGLGAWCDYVTEDEHRAELARSPIPMCAPHVDDALQDFRRSGHFRVHEFAVLADGRRLTLNDDRGFSIVVHAVDHSAPDDLWHWLTLAHLEADVRTTVLPDEDDTEHEHPWAYLAECLRARGIEAPTEQLTQLPYEVEFSQRLRAKLRGLEQH